MLSPERRLWPAAPAQSDLQRTLRMACHLTGRLFSCVWPGRGQGPLPGPLPVFAVSRGPGRRWEAGVVSQCVVSAVLSLPLSVWSGSVWTVAWPHRVLPSGSPLPPTHLRPSVTPPASLGRRMWKAPLWLRLGRTVRGSWPSEPASRVCLGILCTRCARTGGMVVFYSCKQSTVFCSNHMS